MEFPTRQSIDPDICDLDTRQSDVKTYLSDVKSVPESESGPKSIVSRFERFSELSRLVHAFGRLKTRSRQQKSRKMTDVLVTFQETENFIISLGQHDVYSDEIQCIRGYKPIPRGSPLQSLGWIRKASCVLEEDSTE